MVHFAKPTISGRRRSRFGEENIFVNTFNTGSLPSSRSTAVFVTHFHPRNIVGLDNTWTRNKGVIYCSQVTKTLIQIEFAKLTHEMFRVLPMATPYLLNKNVVLTVHPAHYCDGSLMYCFNIKSVGEVLVASHFRVDKVHHSWPKSLIVDFLCLDERCLSDYPERASLSDVCDSLARVVDVTREEMGAKTKICIDASVCGFEPVLRYLNAYFWERFELSAGLAKHARGKQLRGLLSEAFEKDGPFPPIYLCHCDIESKEDDAVWIYPCEESASRYPPFEIDSKRRMVFLYFFSQAGTQEVMDLKKITRAYSLTTFKTDSEDVTLALLLDKMNTTRRRKRIYHKY